MILEIDGIRNSELVYLAIVIDYPQYARRHLQGILTPKPGDYATSQEYRDSRDITENEIRMFVTVRSLFVGPGVGRQAIRSRAVLMFGIASIRRLRGKG